MTDVYNDSLDDDLEKNRVFFYAVGKNEYLDYDSNFCKGSFGMCHDNETNDWWNLWNAEQRDMYIFYRDNEQWKYHCHFSMTEYGSQFGDAITELIDYLDDGNFDSNPAGEETTTTPQPAGDDETSLPTPPPSDLLYPPPPTPSTPPPPSQIIMSPPPLPSPTQTPTGLLPTTPQPTTSSSSLTDDPSQTNVVDAANSNTSGAATTSSRTTTQSSLLMPFFSLSVMMVLCYYMTTF